MCVRTIGVRRVMLQEHGQVVQPGPGLELGIGIAT